MFSLNVYVCVCVLKHINTTCSVCVTVCVFSGLTVWCWKPIVFRGEDYFLLLSTFLNCLVCCVWLRPGNPSSMSIMMSLGFLTSFYYFQSHSTIYWQVKESSCMWDKGKLSSTEWRVYTLDDWVPLLHSVPSKSAFANSSNDIRSRSFYWHIMFQLTQQNVSFFFSPLLVFSPVLEPVMCSFFDNLGR